MIARLRVKEVAKEKGISMTKLHIRSEVAYTTIQRIFRDPYASVSTITLTKLANALEVEIGDLIESVSEENGL